MCGIAAIYRYASEAAPVDRGELSAIRDAMKARGPDHAGLWIADHGQIGLGHRRLAIIGTSRTGAQPMEISDGRFRIVYNGEIYNYRALKKSLEENGHQFHSETDTEVILHLYRQYGPDLVHHLRGMYAFAIWDDEYQSLFLARDPFGIKPLYYTDDGRTVRVASQVKALTAGGRAGRAVEPAGVVGFFLWGYIPEPYTLYDDIHALPAGSWMWIDRNGVHGPTPFFSVRDELAAAEERAVDLEAGDLRAVLRQTLVDSIRHHLVADVDVGIFLSAGLDSSTLTALAAEQHDKGLKTITLGFDEYHGSDIDEVPLAEGMASLFGTSHETCWMHSKDFYGELQPLLAAMDQPTIDGVNVYFISKVAARSGLKAALSGLGGDELFGGYTSYQQVPALARILGPLRTIPNLGRSFRRISAPILKHFTSPKYAGLLEYGTSVADTYLLRRGLFMPWELPEIVDPEMVRKGWLELQTRLRLAESIGGLRRDYSRVAALEFTWYMRNQLLRDADWASMAHSLEVRVPLVDVELFRTVVPLFMGHRRPAKREMALTPAIALPIQVIGRAKTCFDVPFREWLLQGFKIPGSDAPARGGRLRSWARVVSAAFGITPLLESVSAE